MFRGFFSALDTGSGRGPTETSGRRPRRKRWEGPEGAKRTESSAIPTILPVLPYIIEKRLTDSHIDLSVSLLLDCIGIGDYSATTSTLRVALTAL